MKQVKSRCRLGPGFAARFFKTVLEKRAFRVFTGRHRDVYGGSRFQRDGRMEHQVANARQQISRLDARRRLHGQAQMRRAQERGLSENRMVAEQRLLGEKLPGMHINLLRPAPLSTNRFHRRKRGEVGFCVSLPGVDFVLAQPKLFMPENCRGKRLSFYRGFLFVLKRAFLENHVAIGPSETKGRYRRRPRIAVRLPLYRAGGGKKGRPFEFEPGVGGIAVKGGGNLLIPQGRNRLYQTGYSGRSQQVPDIGLHAAHCAKSGSRGIFSEYFRGRLDFDRIA